MNARQKKKVMKKYVIKAGMISTIAESLKNMAGYNFPESRLIDITKEALLFKINADYQNEIYGKVIYTDLLKVFGQPRTLADDHMRGKYYQCHMDLSYKRNDMIKEIRLFLDKYKLVYEIYDAVPIRVPRSESDPECPKLISFKHIKPFDIQKIPEEDREKFMQSIHELNTFIQEAQDEQTSKEDT